MTGSHSVEMRKHEPHAAGVSRPFAGCFAATSDAGSVGVLLSGGMNSAVVLHMAIAAHGRDRVFALSVNYGQPHRCELAAAQCIARAAGVEHVERTTVVHWSDCLRPGAISAPSIVPVHTMFLATLGAIEVARRGGDVLMIGCCADDGVDAERRLAYLDAVADATSVAFARSVGLVAPLLAWPKVEVLTRAAQVPGALAAVDLSWSCCSPLVARGRVPIACGECIGCALRARAFGAARRRDPTSR